MAYGYTKVTEFRGINERIALIKIKLNESTKVTIFQVYAPTSAAPKEETKKFYKTLDKSFEDTSEKYTFIMGDFKLR